MLEKKDKPFYEQEVFSDYLKLFSIIENKKFLQKDVDILLNQILHNLNYLVNCYIVFEKKYNIFDDLKINELLAAFNEYNISYYNKLSMICKKASCKNEENYSKYFNSLINFFSVPILNNINEFFIEYNKNSNVKYYLNKIYSKLLLSNRKIIKHIEANYKWKLKLCIKISKIKKSKKISIIIDENYRKKIKEKFFLVKNTNQKESYNPIVLIEHQPFSNQKHAERNYIIAISYIIAKFKPLVDIITSDICFNENLDNLNLKTELLYRDLSKDIEKNIPCNSPYIEIRKLRHFVENEPLEKYANKFTNIESTLKKINKTIELLEESLIFMKGKQNNSVELFQVSNNKYNSNLKNFSDKDQGNSAKINNSPKQ